MTAPLETARPDSALPELLAPLPKGVTRRPRPWLAFRAVYRMLLRNQATRGRIAVVAGLGGLVVLVAALVGQRGGLDPLEQGTRYLNYIGISLLVPVVSLVFACGSLGDLVDDQSLVYLWLPPVPRWVIALAAWASTVTICLPAVAVPLTLAAIVTKGGGFLIEGVAVSAVLGVVAYTGLFTALGLRFRRALLWGLAYLLLWENFIATAGAGTARLSVLSYLRSLMSAYTGVGLTLADRSLPAAYLVPVIVALVGVVYTARRLGKQDIA